jgi:hypothetical protein
MYRRLEIVPKTIEQQSNPVPVWRSHMFPVRPESMAANRPGMCVGRASKFRKPMKNRIKTGTTVRRRFGAFTGMELAF